LRSKRPPDLNRQTFAPFGAAGIDDGAATPSFHADQKAVGAGAANLGRLVRAFHLDVLKGSVQAQRHKKQLSH
jgi:phage tail tape-measure protein